MLQTIQSPLHPDDEIKAQGLRARLVELQREYQERAQPYIDELVRLENGRRPPTLVFMSNDGARASLPEGLKFHDYSPAASAEGGR